MIYRIEISPLQQWRDARGEGVKRQAADVLGIKLDAVRTRDVYTVSAELSKEEAEKVASLLYNPVLQCFDVDGVRSANYQALPQGKFVLAIGFKPGVTDNVGRSAKAAVGDIVGRRLGEDEQIFSSIEYLLYGDVTEEEASRIARKLLANELIQSVTVLTGEQAAKGIPANLPIMTGAAGGNHRLYDLEVSDEELMELSRKGTFALSLTEMKAIQNYFRNAKGREKYGLTNQPTDVEMEVLAQTWSEHCKHKIFSAVIDYLNSETGERQEIDSCYKSFIKRSTKEIGEEVDFLVSVFHDNAGVITFNDKLDIVYKVE
ncbi:MAG: phosphoribosylformylglycinamidine synthase, partial [Lentisphaeria bacterium]|nr:phosphoribosylformylglycinamidine synthase [Lentisphaeria bacterium]